MKYLLVFIFLFNVVSFAKDGYPDESKIKEYVENKKETKTLNIGSTINISAVGQGVAPSFSSSPAQSYALAKRAAMADAYRILGERIKGVRIEGKDTIKNMAIKNSIVKTQVTAMIRNATIVETTFKNGLCEVEVEIRISHRNF